MTDGNFIVDNYHKHLDECEQCRNHPFNNCPKGTRLLSETINGISEVGRRHGELWNKRLKVNHRTLQRKRKREK